MTEPSISSTMQEDRIFDPPADFIKNTHIDAAKHKTMSTKALEDPQAFWEEQAKAASKEIVRKNEVINKYISEKKDKDD